MSKITAEEALEIIRNNITKAYTYACYNKSTKQNTSVLEEQTHRMVDFLFEQLKTPTLDEVFCNDKPCQYCNLNKRELKMVQSELNDAYVMLQNRDNKIKELERELNYYETK